MENYFILLGLSFDETDESVIKNAIEQKREQWQKEAKNPRKQIQAKENIAKIPEIEDVMLNPSKRKLEAEKALKSQKKYISDLKNEILLISIKGFISEEEYKTLVSKYAQYSISESTIKNNISVPIGEKTESNLPKIESISTEIASQLETYFNNLGLDDMSIYNFLQINFNSNSNEVINKAQLKLKQILEKGNKDNKDEIEQKIAGIAVQIFQQDKIKYDNYLSGCRFYKLNNLIKTAVNQTNELSSRILTTLVKIAINEYNMTKKESVNYIINNCIIKGIKISEDAILTSEDLKNDKEEIKPQNKIEEKPEPEPEINTTQMINQMLTPINTLLVNNKNKISQMSNMLNQYIDKRERTGAAMSPLLSYGSFVVFGILSCVQAIILITKASNLALISIAAIAMSIIEIAMIYPAFSNWNKMKKHCKKAKEYNVESDKLYDDFINLNFNLLVDDNEKIVKQLNHIKETSTKLIRNTENEYNGYLEISKKYYQKEYMKYILLAIALNIGGILLCFFP